MAVAKAAYVVADISELDISDADIHQLLVSVYVDAGYTTLKRANEIFAPQQVRKRGTLFACQNPEDGKLIGMVIVVPPGSAAAKLAREHECEMHLLAVAEPWRQQGIGRLLVKAALQFAQESGWQRMILWTQAEMKAAQALYASLGFSKSGSFQAGDTDFLLYVKSLTRVMTGRK